MLSQPVDFKAFDYFELDSSRGKDLYSRDDSIPANTQAVWAHESAHPFQTILPRSDEPLQTVNEVRMLTDHMQRILDLLLSDRFF